MFDKFTERARKVMSLARQEAQGLNSEFIGTEHILLGIVQDGGGVAAKVLKNLNVDLKRLRQELEKFITPSTSPTVTLGQLPLSPRAKRVIELAGEAGSSLGHPVTGTEHLLLGLLKENEGLAAKVLTKLGLKLDEVRDMVLEVLGQREEAKQGPYPNTTEGDLQKLLEIQARIAAPTPAPCTIRVWIFKDKLLANEVPKGFLMFQGVKVFVSDMILVEGIPFDKQETIAASIAKECGAIGYLVEVR